MHDRDRRPDRRRHRKVAPDSARPEPRRQGVLRAVGLGLITGAADDDPSAIGTYASAGAQLGYAFLWVAPVTFPMMVTAVYLSSKLGQVTGKGLFDVIRDHYPRWILHCALIGVLVGNTIEAAAGIGGMAAAVSILVSFPPYVIVVTMTVAILTLQAWGSYTLIRNIFRWVSLSLLAYVFSALLAKPDWRNVMSGSLIPHVQLSREFFSMLVAVLGTSLSAYLYTWQSNVEVEEEIAMGRRRLEDRRGATRGELRQTRWDIVFGMLFSNIIMYFIILSTAATLFKTGTRDVTSAAEVAEALRPLAGDAAGLLFAIGIIAVGFLAVPIMTTGAAYDVCQAVGWKHGLHAKPSQAKRFYIVIAGFTAAAMCMNFIGINPIKALVLAGIVQGFSAPPLLLLIMLITADRTIMGRAVNRWPVKILGWLTTGAAFSATAGLIWTWLR